MHCLNLLLQKMVIWVWYKELSSQNRISNYQNLTIKGPNHMFVDLGHFTTPQVQQDIHKAKCYTTFLLHQESPSKTELVRNLGSYYSAQIDDILAKRNMYRAALDKDMWPHFLHLDGWPSYDISSPIQASICVHPVQPC